MKCPLLLLGYLMGYKTEPRTKAECLKEQCAWWEQDLNLCAIKEIALELRYTQQRIADIKKESQ